MKGLIKQEFIPVLPAEREDEKSRPLSREEKILASVDCFNLSNHIEETQGIDAIELSRSILASLDADVLRELYEQFIVGDIEGVERILKKLLPINFSMPEILNVINGLIEEFGIKAKDFFAFYAQKFDKNEVPGELRKNCIKNQLIKIVNEIKKIDKGEKICDIVLEIFEDNEFRLRYFEHFKSKTDSIKSKDEYRQTTRYNAEKEIKKKEEIEKFLSDEMEMLIFRAEEIFDPIFCEDEERFFAMLEQKRDETGKDEEYTAFFDKLDTRYRKKSARVAEIGQAMDQYFEYDDKFESLKKHQLIGVDHMVKRKKGGNRTILADEMGLGKTLTGIAAALHSGTKRNVVVCPNSLVENWAKELERTKLPPQNKIIIRSLKQLQELDEAIAGCDPDFPSFVIINNEKLSKANYLNNFMAEINGNMDQTLIVDEAHNFKTGSESSIMAGTLMGLHVKNMFLLTGTPVINDGKDLYNYFHLMNPHKYPMDDMIKPNFIKNAHDKNGIYEIHRELRQYMVRRKIADYDPRIREIKEEMKVNYIEMDMSPEAEKLYVAVVDKFRQKYKKKGGKLSKEDYLSTISLLKRIETDPSIAARMADPGKANEKGRRTIFNYFDNEELFELFGTHDPREVNAIFKDISHARKIEDAVQRIGNLKEDEKAVVYACSPDVVRRISEHLNKIGIKSTFISGEVRDTVRSKDRTNRVDMFNDQNSGVKVLVMNQVGGEGLNLQSANHIFKLDHTWTSAQDKQIDARLIRLGQKRQIFVHSYKTKLPDKVSAKSPTARTIDSYIVEHILPKKERYTEFLIDGLITDVEFKALKEMSDAEEHIMIRLAEAA